jgi:hypothetical protein
MASMHAARPKNEMRCGRGSARGSRTIHPNAQTAMVAPSELRWRQAAAIIASVPAISAASSV